VTLSVLSLFAGIGGLDLGLERAGDCKTRWYSEVDPYACRVMAARFPDAVNLGDITTIDWTTTDARPDIVCGGFPCQDISLAGKGAGIAEGTRSGLWSHYADAIRILRPRLVIVENVAALLARGIGRVLGDLAACGYDAEWDCIPAASVGAPHRRDRIFIIATREHAGEIHSNPTPMHWSTQQRRKPNRDTECVEARHTGSSADTKRIVGERRRGAGNMASSTGAREGTGNQRKRHGDATVDLGTVGAHAPSAGLERARIPGRPTDVRATASDDSGRRHRGSRQQPIKTGFPSTPGGGHAPAPDSRSAEHESDRQAEWRQGTEGIYGRPADHWSVEPDVGRVAHGIPKRVDRLRCLGNAVVPQVAEHVARIALARLSPVMHP